MRNPSFVAALARSFVIGEQSVEQIVARSRRTLGRHWRWLRPLVERYVATFAGQTRPRHRDAIRFLVQDRGFTRASSKYVDDLSVQPVLSEPEPMQPVPAARAWDVPVIESVGALAAWLQLDPTELDWFADLKGLVHRNDHPRLSHYHYRLLTKWYGNIRLIEAPKPRLKEIQRQILSRILDRIPHHPAAHGFVKGRSIKTFIAPHVGRRVVLRMDLRDFFPSIRARRIQALFRTMGYPESVADLAFSGGDDFDRRVGRFSTHVAAILHEEGFTVHHRKTRIMRQGV
jgi:RNA-directed DNA polymerase